MWATVIPTGIAYFLKFNYPHLSLISNSQIHTYKSAKTCLSPTTTLGFHILYMNSGMPMHV